MHNIELFHSSWTPFMSKISFKISVDAYNNKNKTSYDYSCVANYLLIIIIIYERAIEKSDIHTLAFYFCVRALNVVE